MSHNAEMDYESLWLGHNVLAPKLKTSIISQVRCVIVQHLSFFNEK